ncbi:islet amyloid polypeptide [Conger conger]|nr:islet amyloid polypeptide [Conger conger]
MMCNQKLPALLLALSLVLRCVTAAPNNRYATLSSEQADARPEREGWQLSGISKHPFPSLAGALPQGGLTALSGHRIQKRKCNMATCVTQRLADFLVRSSHTLGPLYAPTNVGSNTYGKRDRLQPTSYLPL